MRRHHSGALAARLLVLLLASIAAGCGDTGKAGEGGAAAPGEMAPPSGYPITVVDDAGVTHRFDAAPERIVSIVPSATEFLLALGVGGRIVGRTEYDLDERIAHLPSVGGGLEPSIERIVALASPTAPPQPLLFRLATGNIFPHGDGWKIDSHLVVVSPGAFVREAAGPRDLVVAPQIADGRDELRAHYRWLTQDLPP